MKPQQSIRGMATLLATHLIVTEALMQRYPLPEGQGQGLIDLQGLTLAALDDAARYLPRGEVDRMLHRARGAVRSILAAEATPPAALRGEGEG